MFVFLLIVERLEGGGQISSCDRGSRLFFRSLEPPREQARVWLAEAHATSLTRAVAGSAGLSLSK